MQFKLSWRFLIRALYSGSLNAIALAIVFSIASISAVAVYVDRINAGFARDASALLASDRLISALTPVDEVLINKAKSLNLQIANSVHFYNMAQLKDDQLNLAQVKAVSDTYPLRGQLRIADEINASSIPTQEIPAVGTIWLEPQWLQQYDLKIGDQIGIGYANLKVAKILTQEPDRVSDRFSIAPRILMNLKDLEKTQVIQPGARVDYKLLVAGDREQLSLFDDWLAENLPKNHQLRDANTSRPAVARTLDRGGQFLRLAELVNLILAGVTIAIGAATFSWQQIDAVALLRALGRSYRDIIGLFVVSLALLGVLSAVLGLGLAVLMQPLLDRVYAEFTETIPWLVSFSPLWLSMLLSLGLVMGFALPKILSLKEVPAMRVMKRDFAINKPSYFIGYGISLIFLLILMAIWVPDQFLIRQILLGGIILVLTSYGIAMLLVDGIRKLNISRPFAFSRALKNFAIQTEDSALQILIFSVTIAVALSLYWVKTELISDWQKQLPEKTPNHFAINIDTNLAKDFKKDLHAINIQDHHVYPMVRARLVRINKDIVSQSSTSDTSLRRGIHRPINLTWGLTLPQDNEIIAGQALDERHRNQPVVSVERGVANRLKLSLGDKLTFEIADNKITVEIINIRTVAWESFRPNFFFIFPPGVLNDFPNTSMTSFYATQAQVADLDKVLKNYPSVSVVRTETILEQVKFIIAKVTQVIEFVWNFSFLIALVLLYALIQNSLATRQHFSALLRAIGADNRTLRKVHVYEFTILGLVSSSLAVVAATLVVSLISAKYFNMNFVWQPLSSIIAVVLGTFVVTIFGWLGIRKVLTQPPLTLLRG